MRLERAIPWIVGALTFLLVAGIAALLFAPAVGDVSGRALNQSVSHKLDSTPALTEESCRRTGPRHFGCFVFDRGASNGVVYRVELTGKRCWSARKVSPSKYEEGQPLRRRAKGCVSLRDQVRPVDRILEGLD
ncbi:MAG: hypothetical protein ABR581_02000 [Thermoleophilaceae bacterium]